MWIFQLLIFLNGMETIRKFIDFCGPVVYVVMFALAIWIVLENRPVQPRPFNSARLRRDRCSAIWPMRRC